MQSCSQLSLKGHIAGFAAIGMYSVHNKAVSYHFEVPMIVTDVGGLKETIGDRGTGLVAQECTPEAIHKEILKYFADPHIKEDCIRNIREEKDRLSWSTFAQKLTEFIGQI